MFLSQVNKLKLLGSVFCVVIVLSFSTFFIFSCSNNTTASSNNNTIPLVQVNISVFINDPFYFKLKSIGGWMYIPGGVNGIIVYRLTQDGSSNFIALERTSTYLQNNPKAKAFVQNDNYTLLDSISQSKWQIIDGAVIKGPATFPLKQYRAIFNPSTEELKITN